MHNLESFYNYRTIDDDFKLASSILSNENNLIELKSAKSGISTRKVFEVIPDLTPESSTESKYHNLRLKTERIKYALSKMNNNSPEDENNIDLNNISLSENFDLNQIKEEKQRPEYCRPLPGTAKKPACSNCQQTCSLSIEGLLDPIHTIGQSDILNELQIHNHPRSRMITDQNGQQHQRITFEAARELADHYVYVHNKEWPEFF